MFESSLYITSVTHNRFIPVKHSFTHKTFMFYLNLDELETLAKKLKFFGLNAYKFYSFFDCDHFEKNKLSTKSKLFAHLKDHGISNMPKTIMLLTNLRICNYVFNPVSFYFCFDNIGLPIYVLAEVGNTFDEKKIFVIQTILEKKGSLTFVDRQKKEFYISPFSPLDLELEFELHIPDTTLSIFIKDYIGANCSLTSSLTGTKHSLTDRELLLLAITRPFVTLQIILFIHWHALMLWLKKTPSFPKHADKDKQKQVINPHSSLKF